MVVSLTKPWHSSDRLSTVMASLQPMWMLIIALAIRLCRSNRLLLFVNYRFNDFCSSPTGALLCFTSNKCRRTNCCKCQNHLRACIVKVSWSAVFNEISCIFVSSEKKRKTKLFQFLGARRDCAVRSDLRWIIQATCKLVFLAISRSTDSSEGASTRCLSITMVNAMIGECRNEECECINHMVSVRGSLFFHH